MKRLGVWLLWAITAAGLLGVFLYVEHRERHPEWIAFQSRGYALALDKLRLEAAAQSDPIKVREIATKIDALGKITPAVIEVRPFGGKTPTERCLTCHQGIEDLSESHPNSVFGCVICHGGVGPDLTVKGAHRGLRGGRNPATLELAAAGCGTGIPGAGQCHAQRGHHLLNRTENTPRSLMATNAGIIGILRFEWGLTAEESAGYAIQTVSDGKTALRRIPPEVDEAGAFSLPDSHFRKFCASCHLHGARSGEAYTRRQGCPACHGSYNASSTYEGGDPTINRKELGHPATHSITNRISDDRCRACHNRSARIGLNYHGEMESAQYGTPFVNGGLNDAALPDGRFVWRLTPDIHHETGMACIDCHTGQDTMGDGVIHRFMKEQIEIRCEDCHGSHTNSPVTRTVTEGDTLVWALIRSQRFGKPVEGEKIALTSKSRPLPHVRLTEKGFRLTGKLDGKEHPVTVITGKMDGHAIKGHERLECDTCHSAWSPQCYGCHQILNFGEKGKDHLSGKPTAGRWSEGRGYFRYNGHIFGVNALGKVGILVPGCQVWNTVVNSHAKPAQGYDSAIMKLQDGNTSIKMAPTHPHTSRKEAPRCVDCHLNTKALGLGEAGLTVDPASLTMELEPIYDSAASGLKITFPLDAVVHDGKSVQAKFLPPARGFTPEEIKKIVAIGPCLACHDRYDDPVWRRSGPYKMTPACYQALKRMESGAGDVQPKIVSNPGLDLMKRDGVFRHHTLSHKEKERYIQRLERQNHERTP